MLKNLFFTSMLNIALLSMFTSATQQNINGAEQIICSRSVPCDRKSRLESTPTEKRFDHLHAIPHFYKVLKRQSCRI